MVNQFEKRNGQLLKLFADSAEDETVSYVLREMRELFGEDMPEEESVRAYLQKPDGPTELSPHQQIVATDKLLECAEVNFRTLCDLIRYRQLKENGMVNNVEEFLRLFHPDDFEEETE